MADERKRNDGWELCGIEGCDRLPRLSGLCTQHENQALRAMMDAPSYRPQTIQPSPNDGKPTILLDRETCAMIGAMFRGKRPEDLRVVAVQCQNGLGYGIEECKP